MEPRTPCPYQRMGDDGGCRKRKKTLDIKLVKLLGFLIGESRKTLLLITHRITPLSWPDGRYHETPPWPGMAPHDTATFCVLIRSAAAGSCQRSLLGRVACTPHHICSHTLLARGARIALGPITQAFRGRDLDQHRFGLNKFIEQCLGIRVPRH